MGCLQELSCVYVLLLVASYLHITHSPSTLCALQYAIFWGNKNKNKYSLTLRSLRVLLDTGPKLQSMPQVLAFIL